MTNPLPATERSFRVKSVHIHLDAIGMCASTLCMIHCVVFPLVLAAIPVLSMSNANNAETAGAMLSPPADSRSSASVGGEHCASCCAVHGAVQPVAGDDAYAACCSATTDFWIHVGLLAAVAPLGIVAWSAGYRQHRRIGVLALGMLGVSLLSGALLFGHHLLGGRGEQVMTVAGSIGMVTAHLWNRQQCRCCRNPHSERFLAVRRGRSANPGESEGFALATTPPAWTGVEQEVVHEVA
ncbi:MAG: hypothetical protein KatS3mg111_1873 [Pirellulaceae bacterium]|nr:MAG: hypothetical protein KatS3mg111_1873 [Pirellulaceae bacterium]